jgi:hypothetical protein
MSTQHDQKRVGIVALESRITDNIEEIGETAWNALSGGQPFQSYNWYRFGERVMTNARPTHVILSENGQAIARATFWRVENESLAGGLTAALIKRWPLLICRSPLVVAAPGWSLPNPPRPDVLDEIARLGRQFRRARKCSLLLFDGLDTTTAHSIPHAVRYSFGKPGTVLDIRRWKSFDEYLTSMKQTERGAIRRNLRRAQQQGIVISRHRTVPDLDEAERLYRTLELRKGSERDPWIRGMLENISMVNGTWLAARDSSGQLVACVTAYEDRGTQNLTHMGRDTVRYAYFALLYEGIRLGLEHGLHTLYWGTDSYPLKKRLMFKVLENDSVAIAF